jgi:hypothetical protein
MIIAKGDDVFIVFDNSANNNFKILYILEKVLQQSIEL